MSRRTRKQRTRKQRTSRSRRSLRQRAGMPLKANAKAFVSKKSLSASAPVFVPGRVIPARPNMNEIMAESQHHASSLLKPYNGNWKKQIAGPTFQPGSLMPYDGNFQKEIAERRAGLRY